MIEALTAPNRTGEHMTNTYAINTTKDKEFEVERELLSFGLKPWVPRVLMSKNVKEKPEPIWFDRAYVPKLIFCVIPAIYWTDVTGVKDIHGLPFAFSQRDIDGRPEGFLTHPKPHEHIPLLDAQGNRRPTRAVAGLRHFKAYVEAEYADAEKRRANNDYQCEYVQGDALEILDGAFAGFPASFADTLKRAHDDYATLRVEVQIFGRPTITELPPSSIRVHRG